MTLAHHLASIQEDFNRKLDELELKLINLTDTTLPPIISIDHPLDTNQSFRSVSSIGSSDQDNFIEQFITDLPEKFNTNAEDTFSDIILIIRRNLAKKANTKRLIEKSNSQYVDLSFQRTSTQLTALVNQKIFQEHTELEEEILNISTNLDKLKEHMIYEFNQIKDTIKEIKQIKEDLIKETEFNHKNRERTYKGRHSLTVPLLKRGNINTKLIESKKKEINNQNNIPINLILSPSKSIKK